MQPNAGNGFGLFDDPRFILVTIALGAVLGWLIAGEIRKHFRMDEKEAAKKANLKANEKLKSLKSKGRDSDSH